MPLTTTQAYEHGTDLRPAGYRVAEIPAILAEYVAEHATAESSYAEVFEAFDVAIPIEAGELAPPRSFVETVEFERERELDEAQHVWHQPDPSTLEDCEAVLVGLAMGNHGGMVATYRVPTEAGFAELLEAAGAFHAALSLAAAA